MSTSAVLKRELDKATGVAVLTLDRPASKNALNQELIAGLSAACDALQSDPAVKAIVLTGAGGSFCAGADLAAIRALDNAGGAEFLALGRALTAQLAALPLPTVAAISGYAFGGGLELALACDIRVVATGALLGLPEVRVGAIPGWGGTQRLARLAGVGVALDLVLTGRRVPAEEALSLGVVQRVVPPATLLEDATALAAEIGKGSPAAVRRAKALIYGGIDLALEAGLAAETVAALDLYGHPDHDEGIAAVFEKRPPRWKA